MFPLLAQRLKPEIKFSNFFCLVGNTTFPLKRLIIISISFLLCVTYLLVFTDCEITLPNPNVSFIKCKTPISVVDCVIIKAKSPLLFTIKEPSPSVNPMNHDKKLSEGLVLLGRKALYFTENKL